MADDAHGLHAVNTSSGGRLPNDLVEGRKFVRLARLSRADVDAVGPAGIAGIAATTWPRRRHW